MHCSTVLLLAICLWHVSPSCRADRPADLLTQCRHLCRQLRGEAEVTVDRRQATWSVTGVRFHAESVSDSDLEALAAVTSLETLELRLGQDVPAHAVRRLGALPQLRQLILRWDLTEPQFEAVCTIPNLEDLDLDCTYEGSITDGLRKLSSLRRLSLARMPLSDSSMRQIGSLGHLERLCLRNGGGITDAGVVEIASLHHLHFLQLERLGPGGVATLKSVPHLAGLQISEYKTSPEKADLSSLKNIKSLAIRRVVGNYVGKIPLPQNLESLEVSHKILRRLDLQSSKGIRRIRIKTGSNVRNDVRSACRDGALDLKCLSALPELRELILENPSDAHVLEIARLNCLRGLTLIAGCSGKISDQGMKSVVALQELELLRIEGASLTDAGMEVLRGFGKLRHLHLIGAPEVTARGLATVWDLKRLRTLELSLFGVTFRQSFDGVLEHISTLSELEEARFLGKVTDNGLRKLGSLKHCCRLDLRLAEGYTDDGLASLMRALPELETLKFTIRPRQDFNQGRN